MDIVPCEICGGKNFTISDGFGFCVECGTQSQNVQSMEYEYISGFQDQSKHRVLKIKSEKQKVETKLTSWEEYNYILLGLVNELIAVGANSDFKLTALQLWTEYLRRTEVAFFSKDNHALPKLGPFYKSKDAQVLYNVKPAKTAKRRGRQTKRAQQMKLKKSLLQAEYESNVNGGETTDMSDDHRSYQSSHVSSHTNRDPTPIDLEFSTSARRVLKRVMPLKHLKKHATDKDHSLKCHRKSFSGHLKGVQTEKLSTNTIIVIMYMALNLTKDKIQLSDLIRFLNEGHLSFYDVKHFFPENIPAKTILNFNLTYNRLVLIPSVTDLRTLTAKLCKFLNVQLVQPDLLGLCSRYLNELSLPKMMNDIIAKMMVVSPPEMRHEPTKSLESPNYEGRAISFILYVLKLLFKLDGKTEEEISRTSENLNEKCGTNIFVWTEWVKFIETRKIILKQCHFPTSILMDPDGENSSHLYLEYVHTMKSKMPHELLNNSEGHIYSKMKSILIDLKKLHVPEIKKNQQSFLFNASLQPSKDYLENLLNIQPECIVIPDYMSVEHTERDVSCFIKPNSFRNKLHSKGIDLSINTISNKNLKTTEFFFNELKSQRIYELQVPSFYKFEFQDDNSSSNESAAIDHKEPKTKKFFREKCLFSNETEKLLKKSESNIFDDLTDDELPSELNTDGLEKIPFNMTNFEYWTYMGNMRKVTAEQFSDIENKFPLSFAWVFNECSRFLQMDNRDVYHELLVTENYFSFVLKPFERDQKNLLFQYRSDKGRRGGGVGRESVKKLKKMW